jgi:hypothetical protein
MDILVDFDGTCVTHVYPQVGKSIGSETVLKELIEAGHNIILFTMRSGEPLQDAVDWFNANVGSLYGVNTHPTQSTWTTSPKAYGQLIIDDIGLGIPLSVNYRLSDRPFVDWVKTREMLVERGIL